MSPVSTGLSSNVLLGGAAALSTVALAAYYIGKKVGSRRTTQDYIYKPHRFTGKQTKALDTFLSYVDQYSSSEPDIVAELREWSLQLGFEGRETPIHQDNLLAMLIQISGAKKVIDVGTFTGIAALRFALVLPEDGQVKTIDVDSRFLEHGKVIWNKSGVGHKITAICNDAAKALDDMINAGESGTYDMVFIDADKWNFHEYFTRAVTLVKKGGMIVVDDTLWLGMVCDPKFQNFKDDKSARLPPENATLDEETYRNGFLEKHSPQMHEFNKKVVNNPDVWVTMIPISNGMTLAIKK